MIPDSYKTAVLLRTEAAARATVLEGVLADVLRIIRADQSDQMDAIGQLADKLLKQHAAALKSGVMASDIVNAMQSAARAKDQAAAEASADAPPKAATEG